MKNERSSGPRLIGADVDLEMPTMRCPRCSAEHPDHDGFGFIAHTKPAYPDGCGWCSHPSREGREDGAFVCGICGDVETAEQQAVNARPTASSSRAVARRR